LNLETTTEITFIADELDTDQETDRLLGQRRTNDAGFYQDEKVSLSSASFVIRKRITLWLVNVVILLLAIRHSAVMLGEDRTLFGSLGFCTRAFRGTNAFRKLSILEVGHLNYVHLKFGHCDLTVGRYELNEAYGTLLSADVIATRAIFNVKFLLGGEIDAIILVALYLLWRYDPHREQLYSTGTFFFNSRCGPGFGSFAAINAAAHRLYCPRYAYVVGRMMLIPSFRITQFLKLRPHSERT
jgi:hypothetical protein